MRPKLSILIPVVALHRYLSATTKGHWLCKSIQIQLSYIYNKVAFPLIDLKGEGQGWLSILEIIVKNPVDKLK